MLERIQKCGILALAVILTGAPVVFAQEADPQMYDEELPDDYCSNIGTVKSLTDTQLILDGINWDMESEQDTIEVTYAIDVEAGVELDGYDSMGDIQVGDMIGLECEKLEGQEVVTFIQSEEALNRDMEEFIQIQEEISNIDMSGLEGYTEAAEELQKEGMLPDQPVSE